MYVRSYQQIVLEGLLAPSRGLVVAQGIEVAGVVVVDMRRLAPDTYRLTFRSTQTSNPPVHVWIDEVYRGKTTARSIVFKASDGHPPRIILSDDPEGEWPPIQYSASVDIQWEKVPTASRYRVLQGATVVATIPDDGTRQYFVYTSPLLRDDEEYAYHVIAETAAGTGSPAAAVEFVMVTHPYDVSVIFTYDPATGSVTVSEG